VHGVKSEISLDTGKYYRAWLTYLIFDCRYVENKEITIDVLIFLARL